MTHLRQLVSRLLCPSLLACLSLLSFYPLFQLGLSCLVIVTRCFPYCPACYSIVCCTLICASSCIVPFDFLLLVPHCMLCNLITFLAWAYGRDPPTQRQLRGFGDSH
ncbi:hypothetical protein EV424DRAFT_636507 [Suillus variegatus]|nr:hypothetical protein EV424DRAFT_636507 [Suillus variegatus]